jgi:hypothetical protein
MNTNRSKARGTPDIGRGARASAGHARLACAAAVLALLLCSAGPAPAGVPQPGVPQPDGSGALSPAGQAPGAQAPSAAIPGAEISLPDGEVSDRFYAYLIGLVTANTCGTVDQRQLARVLSAHKGNTAIPFELVKDINRACVSGSAVRDVTIAFNDDLDTPVPYNILGYHPGSVRASDTVSFLEWYLPVERIKPAQGPAVELSQVFVFGIYQGWAVVDIDVWMDKILGKYLDDTRIVVIALFKYKGEWHGLAAGYGRSGEGRSGIFNFHTNKILFPTPRELQVLAPHFRDFIARGKHLSAPTPPRGRWKPKR